MDFSPHPLNIELVVRNILKYQPFSFIKTCRLVSSTWNQAGVTLLRKSSYPIIISCDNLAPLKVLANSEKFPCDKFIIELNHQLLPTNVFELLGKYATQLQFSFCVESINRPEINPYNFTTFPKLTKLCVSFRILNRNTHEQKVGLDIIFKILQTSPNLEKIILRYCDSFVKPVIINLVKQTSSCHKAQVVQGGKDDRTLFGVREEVPGTVKLYNEIRRGFQQGQDFEEIRKMYVESGNTDALFKMNKLKILACTKGYSY